MALLLALMGGGWGGRGTQVRGEPHSGSGVAALPRPASWVRLQPERPLQLVPVLPGTAGLLCCGARGWGQPLHESRVGGRVGEGGLGSPRLSFHI